MRGFVVTGRPVFGRFELVEAAFDHVAQGIDCGIDGKLDQAVPLGRDHRCAAALLHVLANEVSIIALVGKQHIGWWSFGIHDRHISFEVGGFAPCQRHRYGQAQRIYAEMALGREAAF